MTHTCFSVCTWLAASPAPLYSRIVSTMSPISRWISGDRISSTGTGAATLRSTGCPSRATFRMAIDSSCCFSADERIVAYAPRASGPPGPRVPARPRAARSCPGQAAALVLAAGAAGARVVAADLRAGGADRQRRGEEPLGIAVALGQARHL